MWGRRLYSGWVWKLYSFKDNYIDYSSPTQETTYTRRGWLGSRGVCMFVEGGMRGQKTEGALFTKER